MVIETIIGGLTLARIIGGLISTPKEANDDTRYDSQDTGHEYWSTSTDESSTSSSGERQSTLSEFGF